MQDDSTFDEYKMISAITSNIICIMQITLENIQEQLWHSAGKRDWVL